MASGTIIQKTTVTGSIGQRATAIGTTSTDAAADHSKLYNRSLPNQHTISSITGLSEELLNAMHLADIIAGQVVPSVDNYRMGDVIILKDRHKEYILVVENGVKQWYEFGDEASYAEKSTTITGGDGLTGGGDLSANRVIDHATPIGALLKPKAAYKFATDKFGHVLDAEPFIYGTANKKAQPTTVGAGTFTGGTLNKAFEVSYDEDNESLVLTSINLSTKQIYEAEDATLQTN